MQSSSPLTPLAVRRATPDDANLVRGITRAAYAKWIPVIGREPMPMAADYDRAVRDHLIDLLLSGAVPVGLIEMIPEPAHLLIENIAIHPDHHGRGYGRLLMNHAEGVARSLGLPAMRLFTNKSFASNVALYLKLGYGIDREEPFKEGVTVYMSKPLKAS